MLSNVLSETLMFNLFTNGAINANNIKNIVQIIAQINFNGSSIMSVIILIVKITPHAMINKIGFICVLIFKDYKLQLSLSLL